MTKIVKIIRIEKNMILAGCDKSACEGCKSSVFCRGQNSEFEVLNPHDLKLEAGDDVIISMPAGRTVFASAMSLAFPLLCFFLGLVGAGFIFPGREIKQLIAAIITLAAGFLISALYFRLTKGKYIPAVEAKAEDK